MVTEGVSNAAEAGSSLRPAPESLLGVDLGAAFTKAALFEPVEGQYRLIARGQARTTAGTHVLDGLAQACGEIERLTGRELFRRGEPLAGEPSGRLGVEVLAASVSCFRPLRVLATNSDAAVAAISERCAVRMLSATSTRGRVAQLASAAWDAIAGTVEEVQDAALCLDQPAPGEEAETSEAASRTVFIGGDGPAIHRRLRSLALQHALATVHGLPELAAAATEPLTTAAAALLSLTQLVAERFGLRLAVADCGASQAMVAYASASEAWLRLVLKERLSLDFPLDTEQVRHLHADLQRTLRLCVEDGLSADLLLGTGALARFQHWGQPALTLLDGIQPSGVIQFALDSADVVSQIAPFAQTLPDVTSRMFEHDGLTGLGAAVCPRGTVKPGSKTIEVRWHANDQPDQTRVVKAGELLRIPLAPGSKASLSLYPAKPVDVGLNRPGVAATAQIDGGRVGLIVDARFEADGASSRERWEDALK